MGYYVPNRAMPICYNCPYRTNKYCGLLTEHDYLGDYPLNYESYPYCPLIDRPHGEWLDEHEDGHGYWVGTCSQCGKEKHLDNYCSNCGADMRKENER